MNAKKIMGAVLVALLAAALFVGAGAAISGSGNVFIYQNNTGGSLLDSYEGTWTSDAGNQVIVDDEGVKPVGTFVPGIYKYVTGSTTYTLTVTYPVATITGYVGTAGSAYNFIGGNLYAETPAADIHVSNKTTATGITPLGYYVIYPNTTKVMIDEADIDEVLNATKKGTYKLGVYFNISDFVPGTLADFVYTEPVTITVIDADDATITASVDQMNKGEIFTITVTGKPGLNFLVNGTKDAFLVNNAQPGITVDAGGNVSFIMPNTGKVSYTLAGNSAVSGTEQTLKLWSNATIGSENWADTEESVTVKFEKGTLTAKTEKASYFVGDTVKVIGTSTAGALGKAVAGGSGDANIKINGTNFYAVKVLGTVDSEGDSVKTFEFTIDTSTITSGQKRMDVGTYTITLKAGEVEATVPLTLKQPFISIAEAPEVIIQGEEAEFIINAEATNKIGYYIFGTNFFTAYNKNDPVKAHPEDEEGEDIENQFIVELTETQTKEMAAGQYFAVFQHPMYDQEFNVSAAGKIITVNTNEYTIDVNDRQTANAAQALCDALDAQGIDDMYVKASFFVVGKDQSFTISEIPTTVAQGETITISGVSTAAAEDTVVVEMISTAFAAVPKETVGSAAFIVVTTQVAEDGTWEVTLDTSDLNVDEYSLNVACEGTTWKNTKINVVEAADKPDTPDTPDVPDTPDTPDTPTEPETPGFGALAALAGLGAVAVLLLRRE